MFLNPNKYLTTQPNGRLLEQTRTPVFWLAWSARWPSQVHASLSAPVTEMRLKQNHIVPILPPSLPKFPTF